MCLYSAVCSNVGFANDEGDILGYVTTRPELPSYLGMQVTTLTKTTCRKQCFVYLLFYLYGIGKSLINKRLFASERGIIILYMYMCWQRKIPSCSAFTLRFFCAKTNNNVQLKTCLPSHSMVHSKETNSLIKIPKYHQLTHTNRQFSF